MTQAIFTLPFVGKNFFRGIVINDDLPFGKDATYQLLKGTTFNWRRLLLCMGRRLFYTFNGTGMDLMAIYRKLKKLRGRAKILASTRILLKGKVPAKLVFVRDKRKKNWLALLSTDTDLADEDVARIYGKRWDIEVFFKMAKQHLKLAKEIQCRDFDALIAHTSIVFMRYMFLAYQCRIQTDHRSFGDLFYACCDEVADISFIEALLRILALSADRLKKIGTFCEHTATAFFDAIMDTALQCVGLSKNKVAVTNA